MNQTAAQSPVPSYNLLGRLGLRLRRSLLAIALAIAIFALPFGIAGAKPSTEPAVSVELAKNGTLFIGLQGEIGPGMAKYLHDAFQKYAGQYNKVVFVLDSPGGSVAEGEKVIAELKKVKQSHRLVTAVLQGSTCASMCVPIYLQGDERVAAGASLWLFHEVAEKALNGLITADPDQTQRLFDQYFLTAGVSPVWIKSILPTLRDSNLWMTGEDLMLQKTGVITRLLDNRTQRGELRKASDPGPEHPAPAPIRQ